MTTNNEMKIDINETQQYSDDGNKIWWNSETEGWEDMCEECGKLWNEDGDYQGNYCKWYCKECQVDLTFSDEEDENEVCCVNCENTKNDCWCEEFVAEEDDSDEEEFVAGCDTTGCEEIGSVGYGSGLWLCETCDIKYQDKLDDIREQFECEMCEKYFDKCEMESDLCRDCKEEDDDRLYGDDPCYQHYKNGQYDCDNCRPPHYEEEVDKLIRQETDRQREQELMEKEDVDAGYEELDYCEECYKTVKKEFIKVDHSNQKWCTQVCLEKWNNKKLTYNRFKGY